MAKSEDADKSRDRGSNRTYPANTLEDALTLVEAIAQHNAAKSMDRILLAKALGTTPSSSSFRTLISSSSKYGLTEGNEKSDYIAPTALELRIAKPESATERIEAIKEAALKPEVMAQIMTHYNRNKWPQGEFFLNTLERTFKIPGDRTKELADFLEKNGVFASLFEDISGSKYVRMDGVPQEVEEETAQEAVTPAIPTIVNSSASVVVPSKNKDTVSPSSTTTPSSTARPKKIFVAHGKNHQSMEQLGKILNEFKIPHVVALNEANAGRPISKKIAEIMESCSAAIFVFTKDEEFTNMSGEQVWRPSENLIYELGVASYLYGNKIILLKEEGIKFASDFQDLGYITFKSGDIAAKSVELFRELIALNFISVQVQSD